MADGGRVLSYIGSKASVATRIRELFLTEWGREALRGATLVDAFAGTGAVTAAVADLFAACVVNDAEPYSAAVCVARFAPPRELPDLSYTPASGGFVEREYALNRQFFSPANGAALDGLRAAIRDRLPPGAARTYAVGCMLMAADRVANTAGVYGAYLKHLLARAAAPLDVRHPRTASPGPLTVTLGDAEAACAAAPPGAVLYLDPPYTARAYGSNYFVLNVLADVEAEPELRGVSGIPASGWRRSAWNTAAGADASLRRILKGTPATRCAMSYSSDGLLTADQARARRRIFFSLFFRSTPVRRCWPRSQSAAGARAA